MEEAGLHSPHAHYFAAWRQGQSDRQGMAAMECRLPASYIDDGGGDDDEYEDAYHNDDICSRIRMHIRTVHRHT